MRKLEPVDSRYGAPMGRANLNLIGDIGPVKLHLQQVRLDSGGYDEGGAYWGQRLKDRRLYWYWWNTNVPNASLKRPLVISGFITASNRTDAKTQIREQYPQAKFYR